MMLKDEWCVFSIDFPLLNRASPRPPRNLLKNIVFCQYSVMGESEYITFFQIISFLDGLQNLIVVPWFHDVIRKALVRRATCI